MARSYIDKLIDQLADSAEEQKQNVLKKIDQQYPKMEPGERCKVGMALLSGRLAIALHCLTQMGEVEEYNRLMGKTRFY